MTDRTLHPDGPIFKLWSRIPRLLFGGRIRTTTLLLVIIFIGAGILYGQRSEYYSNLDKEAKVDAVSAVRSPTTTPAESESRETMATTSELTATASESAPRESASRSETPDLQLTSEIPISGLPREIPTTPITTSEATR